MSDPKLPEPRKVAERCIAEGHPRSRRELLTALDGRSRRTAEAIERAIVERDTAHDARLTAERQRHAAEVEALTSERNVAETERDTAEAEAEVLRGRLADAEADADHRAREARAEERAKVWREAEVAIVAWAERQGVVAADKDDDAPMSAEMHRMEASWFRRRALVALQAAAGRRRRGVYTASRTHHAARWRALRDAGVPVVSTWIDEAGAGESTSLVDLWRRCVAEASSAATFVLYHEPGDDPLKGAFVEAGAALAAGVPVFVVGHPPGSWVNHPLVRRYADLDSAMRAAAAAEPVQGTVRRGRDHVAEYLRNLAGTVERGEDVGFRVSWDGNAFTTSRDAAPPPPASSTDPSIITDPDGCVDCCRDPGETHAPGCEGDR